MMIEKKNCSSCHESKPFSEFYKEKVRSHTGGVDHRCKECEKKRSRLQINMMYSFIKLHRPEWLLFRRNYIKNK